MIRVFIGFDEDETVAAHTLHQSIVDHSSMPVSVSFINRRNLRGIYTRARGKLDSTDFSISRFIVPYLCDYHGHAIFMDCDMVCLDDIAKLWAWRDENYAVRVAKHDYTPREDVKFLGQVQTKYERKNWSSVILFNNALCSRLTLDYVTNVHGLLLHQFSWLEDDSIGEIPKQWNHLVGHDAYDPKASLAHFTTGGPYFDEYKNCDYHQQWFVARTNMLHVLQRNKHETKTAIRGGTDDKDTDS